MSYWYGYDRNNGNALIGLSDTPLPPKEGVTIIEVPGEMPDMSRFAWNTATLSWYEKPRHVLTKREFLRRFDIQEYAGIRGACNTSAVVEYYWQMFNMGDEIILDHPDVLSGMALLEQAGLIASGRAAEILK